MTHDEVLELARSRGRRAAQDFEQRLRDREAAEREQRLITLCLDPEAEDLVATARQEEDAPDQRDFQRLLAFHSAVNRSRAWRLVQALRRPLGRAW